jgi:hypothetical protein
MGVAHRPAMDDLAVLLVPNQTRDFNPTGLVALVALNQPDHNPLRHDSYPPSPFAADPHQQVLDETDPDSLFLAPTI